MTNKDECCPKFNPEKWDGKAYSWDEKKFIKESVPALFHIPFFPLIGKKIKRMMKHVESASALEEDKTNVLFLFTDPHPFKSEFYLSVTKDVPHENNVTISGTFEAKVFDGPSRAIPKFIEEMKESLDKKGRKAGKYYVHYAYCPKCSKKFGNNYMVLFAKTS